VVAQVEVVEEHLTLETLSPQVVAEACLAVTPQHKVLSHKQATVALVAVVLQTLELGVLVQKVELEAHKVILLAELVAITDRLVNAQTLAEEAARRLVQAV
jgi:hypothetical protein